MSADKPWEDYSNPLTTPPEAPAAGVAGPWSGYQNPIPTPAPAEPRQRAFNEPFGELKPYTPSPSERIGNVASDVFRAAGADPYTAGKFGRGTRDVLMMTPAGVPISGADVQHYTNQGDLSNAALSAVGVIPGGNIGRAAVGQQARQLAPNFANTALGETFRAAPSSEQLMTAGGQQIRDFANSPAVYSPQAARTFINDTRASLRRAGLYPGEHAGTYEALQVLEDKAAANGLITRQDVDEFRAALSSLKKGQQAPSAMHAQSQLYDAMQRTGDDTLQRGIENYGAGKRTEKFENILAASDRAKNPDVTLENKLRSEAQSIDVRPRGYTREELAAVDRARTAGSGRDRIADALTFKGVPMGVASQLAVPGAAAGLGVAMFGPGGAALGAIPPAAAMALRSSAGGARRAAAEGVTEMTAQRSPLFREAQAANTGLTYPGSPAQDYVMRNAIAQELVRRQRGETD